MASNISDIDALYSATSALTITMAFLYVVIITFGLSGNALTIAIVWRNKSMQSPTNLLLVNIAVADVISLLLCSVPYAVSVSRKHPTGELGQYLCKFVTGHATTAVTVSVTYLTLVLLAVERYHGIVKPFKRELRLTKQKVVFAIALLWLFSIGISLFAFLSSRYDETNGRCMDLWTLETVRSSRTVLAGLLAIPGISFCLMLYCYFQIVRTVYFNYKTSRVFNTAVQISNRRIVKILLTVTTVFHFCYAPFLLFEITIAHMDRTQLFHDYETFYIVYRILTFFIYLNSCLNPFCYGFQSSAFRQNLKNITGSCWKRTKILKSGRYTIASKKASRETPLQNVNLKGRYLTTV